MNRNKITAFVLTYNAEAYIENCLQSLKWADEVMIVDSYSQDNTVAIAEKMGVRVLSNHWPGYGLQLQFALENASHDWVFFTDQDEVVTPELSENILSELKNPKYQAYRIKRQNMLLGKWLSYGGSIEKNIRFVNRKHVSYCDSQHTYICEKLNKKTLNGVVRHDMAPSLEFWWKKSIALATIEAETDYAKGARFSSFKLLGAFGKFFRRFVFKLGFLDGKAGLYMALQRSLYIFAYQACLYELSSGVREIKQEPNKTKFR